MRRELLVLTAVTLACASFLGCRCDESPDVARSVSGEIRLACGAVEEYFIERGVYPRSLDELVSEESVVGETYLVDVPRDPWGRRLAYALVDDRFPVIWSYGRDGVSGGEGEDADVSSLEVWDFD